jgi:protein O-GlcNAc transferase
LNEATMSCLDELEHLLVVGDVASAEALASRADDREAELVQARLAFHSGRCDEARERLERSVARSPKHPYARMLLGLVHDAQGRPDAALLEFQQATRFGPTLMPAWFNQARVMLARGRVAEAAIAFERAAGLEPDNLAVLAAWAQTLAKLRHARRATTIYLRCIEQSVANPFFVLELAELLLSDGEGALAEELLEAGSKAFPSQGLFDSRRATLALDRQDTQGAVRLAREALRREPDRVEFLLGLAVVELARTNLVEARAAAEKALSREPENWKALHQLGVVFDAMKLHEKACSFFRRALERAPHEWLPRHDLAVVLLESGHPREVKEALGLLDGRPAPSAPGARLTRALDRQRAVATRLAEKHEFHQRGRFAALA